MSTTSKSLKAFFDRAPVSALVEITEAKGSTPREKGAWMLVSPERIFGTIGGGQLEFLAIDKARELIEQNISSGTLDIPLGPEIGQCCGGRVGLGIRIVHAPEREDVTARAERADAARPHVYLFGGGHVGMALAKALSLLPVRTVVVETREEALADFPADVETHLSAMPEEMVRSAPAGSAIVVLTHDHALDFLITSEALTREDMAYVGMIGSKTKKATFKSWFLKNGGEEAQFAQTVTPIGGNTVRDKRPSIIAALVAAEVMEALASHGSFTQS